MKQFTPLAAFFFFGPVLHPQSPRRGPNRLPMGGAGAAPARESARGIQPRAGEPAHSSRLQEASGCTSPEGQRQRLAYVFRDWLIASMLAGFGCVRVRVSSGRIRTARTGGRSRWPIRGCRRRPVGVAADVHAVRDQVLHHRDVVDDVRRPFRVVGVGDPVLGDPDRHLLPVRQFVRRRDVEDLAETTGSVGWLKSLHVGEDAAHRTGRPFRNGNPGIGATPRPCIGCDP